MSKGEEFAKMFFMSAEKLQLKPLSSCNVVVTGGSRDIGGGIVLELAKTGAKVLSVFRSKPERAQKIADEVKTAGGKEPILLQADLVTQEGKDALFKAWDENFKNDIDILVLCASGATMEINVDANMALVDKFLELRAEKIKSGKAVSEGRIIFLQSEPGHFQRVIDGVFDFLDYYRDKVGPAKRAGEDAFRKRLSKMEEAGVRGITVCPPEVTDTFNMKLFELQNKEARTKSRELSKKLGTEDFVTIAQVAERVHELIEDQNVPNGHLELFNNISDGMTVLSSIYGDEAIYVHTFKKTSETTGVGRLIVNPSIWKKDMEPSFVGEIVEKSDKEQSASLDIVKEHMPGHFRDDIASLFPGHKSIRTAFMALSRFLQPDSGKDESNVRLRSYVRVKFKGTVVPGDKLVTKVKILPNPPLEKEGETARFVTGDAVQSVNESATTEIDGMIVERVEDAGKSVLCLDQLVEAGAQAVGIYVLQSMKDAGGNMNEVLPLFHSTGEANMSGDIAAGDNILIYLEKARIIKANNMNIFSADAVFKKKTDKGEEEIAFVRGLSGVIMSKEEVLKKI